MLNIIQKDHVFENTQKLFCLLLKNYLKFSFLFFQFLRSMLKVTSVRFLAINELKGNILLSS